jgi:hypothetical protein
MPWHWPMAASVLSHSVGWEPPMMMIATLGVIVPLNVGVGLLGNKQLAATFNLTTTLSWFIVSFAATSIVVLRCIRNIRRYGITGFTRPNWWYECGRLNMILTLFSLIACPAAFYFQLGDPVISALLIGCVTCAVAFVLTTSVGYASSFVNGFRSNTKAFQCVHYFYCTLVPVGLLIASAMFWPQPVFWPNGCLVVLSIAGSAILCAAGMLSISTRHKQWNRQGS